MRRSIVNFCLLIGLGACSQAPAPPETALGPSSPGSDGAAVASMPNVFGIGDVDSAMQIQIRLGERSQSPTVHVQERMTQLKKLVNVAIAVMPPVADELWLSMTILSQINFPGNAVVVSAKIFVDDKQTGAFSYAIGADAHAKPKMHEFNVLEGLEAPPKSMLVRATADLALYRNMDPADIDLDTPPAVGPEDKATILSNPVRIEF